MSAIFGIVDWTGAPIRPEDGAALVQASAPLHAAAPPPATTADSGPRTAWWLGAALRHDLPEDVHARVPHVDGGVTFVGAGRLDDRDGVARALGVAPAERGELADVDLLRLAYRAWGADELARLPGDWALAAWHAREQRLVLARDPYGFTALHYAASAGRVAFASSLRAVLAVPWVDRTLCEERLAEFLVAPRLPGDAGSLFRGVSRVLPAHTVTLSAEGATARRYWRLEDDVPALPPRSDAEHVEAVREAYDLAVRCRLRGTQPAAMTLSGGLDSTSMTALAARALREGAPSTRLAAYTWAASHATREGRNEFANEVPLAEAVGRHLGNVDVHRVTTDTDPIAVIDQMLACHVVPAIASTAAGWIDETLRQARTAGAGALHVGVSGNVTISWAGIGPLRWTAAWRRGGLAAALRETVRPFVPTAVVRHRQKTGIESWLAYSPIADAFAARMRLAERVRAADPTIDAPPLTPLGRRLHSLGPRSGHESTNLWTYGHEHGLRIVAPTIDLRLVRLCLAIPDDAFSGHGRDRRWLIRELTRDLLPDVVRSQTARGRQGADTSARLRAHAPLLTAALDTAAAVPIVREYLDVERMRAAWRSLQASDDIVTSYRASIVFLRGMAFATFLAPLRDFGPF